MREFTYTINDPIGIHARPAGLLVKMCKEYKSDVNFIKGEKSVQGVKLIALMGLGVKQGDAVMVTATGEDEDRAIEELNSFFNENL